MTMTHARAIVLCFLRVTTWLPPHIVIIHRSQYCILQSFEWELFIGPRIAAVLNYFSALSFVNTSRQYNKYLNFRDIPFSFGILFKFLTANLSGESDIS